jgi:hypothetical protein
MNLNKEEKLFEYAIDLLVLVEQAVRERRKYEQMCGYPEEYGRDKEIYEYIKEFLNSDRLQQYYKQLREKSERIAKERGPIK